MTSKHLFCVLLLCSLWEYISVELDLNVSASFKPNCTKVTNSWDHTGGRQGKQKWHHSGASEQHRHAVWPKSKQIWVPNLSLHQYWPQGTTGACTIQLYGFVIYKKWPHFWQDSVFSIVSHKYTCLDQRTSLLWNL